VASLADDARPLLAKVRSALLAMAGASASIAPERRQVLESAESAAASLNATLERTFGQFADSLKSRWPLEDVLAVDVIAAASRASRPGSACRPNTRKATPRCGFAPRASRSWQAIVFLASRLKDHYEIRELRLRVAAAEKVAFVDLIWSGILVSSEALHTWELDPMSVGDETTSLTLRDMLDRHGGEIRYLREKAAHRALFRLVLPLASTQVESAGTATDGHAPEHGGSRPEYYDFNLFDRTVGTIDVDRRLAELAYTVFDTETRASSRPKATRSSSSVPCASSTVACCIRRPSTSWSIRACR